MVVAGVVDYFEQVNHVWVLQLLPNCHLPLHRLQHVPEPADALLAQELLVQDFNGVLCVVILRVCATINLPECTFTQQLMNVADAGTPPTQAAGTRGQKAPFTCVQRRASVQHVLLVDKPLLSLGCVLPRGVIV